MRMMTIAFGSEAIPVTLATVSQLTTDTSSPQWTGIMTLLLNVVLVLLLMVEDGGSTGSDFSIVGVVTAFHFLAALNPT